MSVASIAAALYLAAGLIIVLLPASRATVKTAYIAQELSKSTRGTPSTWLHALMRAVLGAVIVVAWPLYLRAEARKRAQGRTLIEESFVIAEEGRGLTFSNLGGLVTIVCTQCAFRERITSFWHGVTDSGERCCELGRQCLSCGRFVAVHGIGEPARFGDSLCECGGETSRDHVLFCPSCRSTQLRYLPGPIA